MTECDICCVTIKHEKQVVECPTGCRLKCCVTCFRTNLLETSGATCMGCQAALSLDFIASVTPKTFYNKTYRDHRTENEMSVQMSLLPTSQHLVTNLLEANRIEKTQLPPIDDEMEYLQQRMNELQHERDTVIRTATGLRGKKVDRKADRRTFIQACPNGECRGFLSSAWKCGTCESYVCSDCHVVKAGRDDPNHLCDEGEKATVALLKADTKPCPKCAVLITKVLHGCDQMWCVQCNTQFSWNRGVITNEANHNPHYYQHQREQNNGVVPRQPGDVRGGGCDDRVPSVYALEALLDRRGDSFPVLINCHRLINHVLLVIMVQEFPVLAGVPDSEDLRVSYLMNEITKNQMKSTLQKRVKRREKNTEVTQVLQMFVDTLSDLFRNYINGARDNVSLHTQAHALRDYVNRQLHTIGSQYANKTPHFDKNWNTK
jgi:hypothetical protein